MIDKGWYIINAGTCCHTNGHGKWRTSRHTGRCNFTQCMNENHARPTWWRSLATGKRGWGFLHSPLANFIVLTYYERWIVCKCMKDVFKSCSTFYLNTTYSKHVLQTKYMFIVQIICCSIHAARTNMARMPICCAIWIRETWNTTAAHTITL